VTSNKSLQAIADMISKCTTMYFAETLEEMEAPIRKRLEDYLLLRFRQIFALAGGAGYPCEDLEKLLRAQKRSDPERLEKLIEGVIRELKAYIDSEEREKERKRRGMKPLIEEYVT